jgi:hypothetical protein
MLDGFMLNGRSILRHLRIADGEVPQCEWIPAGAGTRNSKLFRKTLRLDFTDFLMRNLPIARDRHGMKTPHH